MDLFNNHDKLIRLAVSGADPREGKREKFPLPNGQETGEKIEI